MRIMNQINQIKQMKQIKLMKRIKTMKQTKQIKQMKQMKRKHKRLGIIGGLGPESSCSFCLNVNKQFRQIKNCQPDIVLELLHISAEAEKGIINGDMGEEHFQLITKAVKRLNK